MKYFSGIKFFAILIAAIAAALTFSPAFAAGAQNGDRICTGNILVLHAGDSAKNVLAFGCNVTIEQGATVSGDFFNAGGNATVDGQVGGSAVMLGGNLDLQPNAVINRDVVMLGGNLDRAQGAVVKGSIGKNPGGLPLVPPVAPPAPPVSPVPPIPFALGGRQFFLDGNNFLGINLFRDTITALALAALGALLVVFAPTSLRRVSDAVQAKPVNSAGIGCLSCLVLVVLTPLLAITLIGIPVAVLLFFASIIAVVFGYLAIGWLAGEKILEAFKAREVLPIVAVIVGVIVLAIVGEVPVLGGLIKAVIGFLALGAVVLTRFGSRPYPPIPTLAMVPVSATPMTPAAPPSIVSSSAATPPAASPSEPVGGTEPPTSTDATPGSGEGV